MKTITPAVVVAGLAALAAIGCSAPVDESSRRDLPEAPLAPGVARTPWRDPNRAPADEILVVLWWDAGANRLTRIMPRSPVYSVAYYDDAEVRRICEDKVRTFRGEGKPAIAVYARRGVQPAQAIHVANSLAASNAGAVRLLIEE